jgi:hypothetical protein
VDISPLVAATLALWGHTEHAPKPEPEKTYYFDPNPEKKDSPEDDEETWPDDASLDLKTGKWG